MVASAHSSIGSFRVFLGVEPFEPGPSPGSPGHDVYRGEIFNVTNLAEDNWTAYRFDVDTDRPESHHRRDRRSPD